ncbi:MAG: hypothetical protein RI553_06465 [Salibaculum sp.]|uniref:hypothetical protein n=1 Tax=Salibaculum sp. TaxID=2855480 RepID=UPI00286FE3F8|nr:hypothetical protein [Salibaculum sp.]MDR9427737.1 hypothetical protein [Salibaculum sp.]
MWHSSLSDFLSKGKTALAKGPVALVMAEDAVELDSTIRHARDAGFKAVAVFALPEITLADDLAEQVHRVDYDTCAEGAMERAVNAVIGAAGPIWFHYCYNAEYLFYPFREARTVGEMLAFNTEERRDTILTYVIDLYAGDLGQHPDAIAREDAHLDKSGYYALSRKDRWNNDLDRQMNFFGGLRWRFEEHIPKQRRRIDRVSLFRNKPGLELLPGYVFNDPEYNTYSCPWHHNLTAAVCSFRTAKALKRNPGSTFDIDTFRWHNSTPFVWHSQQLLDLGLMEPGQWF